MSHSRSTIDWRSVVPPGDDGNATPNNARLRHLLAASVAILLTVLARIVSLELTAGAQQRSEAARPITRDMRLAAPRGRILAADGTVLARDEPQQVLSVQYRWLEQPANARWLRSQARARLSRAERRDSSRIDAEIERIRADQETLHHRLAALCGLTDVTFAVRAAEVQRRVRAIADRVNAGRSADAESSEPITVREELAYHVLHRALSLEAIAEIEGHPERYPGVRVEQSMRRVYDRGPLAAHVMGHLGVIDTTEVGHDDAPYAPGDRIGRMGLERQYEAALRGKPGVVHDRIDRAGRVLDRQSGRAVQPGDDLVLTLDPALERTAEQLLDETLRRRRLVDADDSSAGGAAAIVLDVRTGAVYCAASAPRFDPNLLGSHAADLLDNPAKPLFDRATKMAIPPGSVFKLVTAAALLEHEGFDADEAYLCRGYLRDPDHLRCMLYRRQGIGHGEATLVDALAQSCNTYFFHQAERLGAPAIFEWSRRFALGVPTGIDLPDEAAGQVADPVGRSAAGQTRWSLADTQALAIGQSTLAVTPLQMARAMAAVANGGRLVTPRVVRSVGLVTDADDGTSPAPASSDAPALGLSDRSLAVLREGLERVVADERGTGHRTVFLPEVMIAGKTGTAETGTGRADHAWFVGYAPADRPCVALAIVIEHGGSGAEIAGPVAKRLVQKLADLGYFTPGRSLAVTGTSDISKP